MKRLNRKGFTLIELLAVIVVLAIVLVVTIPSVLRSVNNAREKSLKNAANAVSDWLTRQSELAAMADTGITDDKVDKNYATIIGGTPYFFDVEEQVFLRLEGSADEGSPEDLLLKSAGFGGGIKELEYYIIWYNGSKICVELGPDSSTNSTSRFKGLSPEVSDGC